ncbi:MAG TPA: zf-HC2 domain-containing protein [Candidatus Acidoferrum sp.]
MSELLHPGQHPDADQVSAFAEGVLPGHERAEMLAHLAECADCRQIVFLAQQTQEAEIPPSDAPAGHVSWWKNWGRLWPAAAALACGLLVAAFLQSRQSRNMPQKSAAFESIARAVSPLQEKLPAAVFPEVRPPAPAPSRKSTTRSKAGSSPHPSLSVPGSDLDGFPRVHGSLATDYIANNPSVFNADAPVSSQQKNGALSADTSSLGSALGFPVAKPTPLQEQQVNPFNDGAQTRVLKAQSQTFSQRAAAARPLSGPSQSDIQRSASQTVAVTNEAPVLQTENVVVSSGEIGGPIPLRAISPYGLRAPLPSKRPAISTISNGHETLAVDSAGDVFASQDAGRVWRQIAHQWTGKAIKVRLAVPNSMTETGPSPLAGSTASINSEAAKAAPVPLRVGFELVTETGSIWSSPDGLAWRPR